mmetsp:Transcript_15939/g.32535  ORF Transcript_15939/g.32535 Transcript_15939/m.32535 type:complete len:827 (-) Transcript_15939:505-2985(-)
MSSDSDSDDSSWPRLAPIAKKRRRMRISAPSSLAASNRCGASSTSAAMPKGVLTDEIEAQLAKEGTIRRQFVAEGKEMFQNLVSRLAVALDAKVGRAEEDRRSKMKAIEDKLSSYRRDKEKEWGEQKEAIISEFQKAGEGNEDLANVMKERQVMALDVFMKWANDHLEAVEAKKEGTVKKVEDAYQRKIGACYEKFSESYINLYYRVQKMTRRNQSRLFNAAREGREKLGMACPGAEDSRFKFSIEDDGAEVGREEKKMRDGDEDDDGSSLFTPLVFPPFNLHPVVQRIDRVTRIKKKMPVDWVVEIHNEGVMKRTRKKVDPTEGDDYLARIEESEHETFLPWGSRARSFLYTVMCGLIPEGHPIRKPRNKAEQLGFFPDSSMFIKCFLIDMRTSMTTASISRSRARQRFLDEEINKMTRDEQDAVKQEKEARERSKESQGRLQYAERKAVEAAKRVSLKVKLAARDLEGFRKRCNCDDGEGGAKGKLTDTQEVHMRSLEAKLEELEAEAEEASEQVQNAQGAVAAIKAEAKKEAKAVTKAESALRKAKKNAEAFLVDGKAKGAVKSTVAEDEPDRSRSDDVLRVILATVEGRRNLTKAEVDAKFDVLPSDSRLRALKDDVARLSSLRRTNILLRPQVSSLVDDFLNYHKAGQTSSAAAGQSSNLSPRLLAEQKLLLALHPSAEMFKYRSSNPTKDRLSGWANPGWLVDTRPNPRLNLKHAEFASLRVSQLAAVANQDRLRLLQKPLDLVAQATSCDTHIREGEMDWRLYPGDIYGKVRVRARSEARMVCWCDALRRAAYDSAIFSDTPKTFSLFSGRPRCREGER